MSETANLVEFPTAEKEQKKALVKGALKDELNLDAIFENELERMSDDDFKTVGDVWTYICRCVVRGLIGDDEFYTVLPEGIQDDEKSFEEFMNRSGNLIVNKVQDLFERAGNTVNETE